MNIGETSKQSDISERMIRHFEKIRLIPAPPRRGVGYRDYGERDLYRLRFIADARDLGPFPPQRRSSRSGKAYGRRVWP